MQIPSPDVKYYDRTPAMSSKILIQLVLEAIKQHQFDFIVLNVAATQSKIISFRDESN